MRYPNDPRIRQTLNNISSNLEAANQRTQTSVFAFSESYVRPCLGFLQPCLLSVQTCVEASCQPCFSAYDDSRRNRQPRQSRRGRDGAAFDFYDDWDEDETEWGNDEMDALLAGNQTQQPGRHAILTYGYGSRGGRRGNAGAKDALADDPTLVPQSSMFGFLEGLPWKIGGRGTRYKPNAANLQENIGKRGPEAEALLDEEESGSRARRPGRARNGTTGSQGTGNSLSSRDDLFPSDDEGDAMEIDEEYAMVLGRRTTTTSDDRSSRKRPGTSRASTKSASSRQTQNDRATQNTDSLDGSEDVDEASAEVRISSLEDLKQEEEKARADEEDAIEARRKAAQLLAEERGLLDSTIAESERKAESSNKSDDAIDREPALQAEPDDDSAEPTQAVNSSLRPDQSTETIVQETKDEARSVPD